MFERLKKWVIKKWAKPVDPFLDPTYGFYTTATPRFGIEQDSELIKVVEGAITGCLLSGKKLTHFEILAHYEDGSSQRLMDSTNPYTKVYREKRDDGIHFIIDDSRLEI